MRHPPKLIGFPLLQNKTWKATIHKTLNVAQTTCNAQKAQANQNTHLPLTTQQVPIQLDCTWKYHS